MFSSLRLGCIFTVLCSVRGQSSSDQDVALAFQRNELTPQVLPYAPAKLLQVIYPEDTARLGNEIRKSQALTEPTLAYDSDPNCLYTVIMFDPDAPSRAAPTYGPFRHWVKVNIRGDDVATSGDTLAPYRPPGPPEGSGLHRYTIIVYKQTCRIAPYQLPAEMRYFDVVQLAQNNRLQEPPEFGNFYQTQFE